MKENNKMYSMEVVQSTIRAMAVSFFDSFEEFEKALSKLPKEIQNEVIASATAAKVTRVMNMIAKSKALKGSLEKLSKIENPTKDDFKRVFDEVFGKENK